MKYLQRTVTLLLCLALTLGLSLSVGAIAGPLGDNELPIIPIQPPLCQGEHTWNEGTVETAPGCTTEGVMRYHCTKCKNGEKTEPIPALGHAFGDWTVTKAAACTVSGEEMRSCTRCGEVQTRPILPVGHRFADGVCTVCGEKDPDYTPPKANPFTDVATGSYYYDAVLWAVEQGVTNGKTATRYAPGDPCTRAQVVTFLWRAYGSPAQAAAEVPFTDVKGSAYYCSAVLWAVEKGITNGMSATSFAPDNPCTRGQVVTFLWRAAGQPEAAEQTNPFADVPQNSYYAKAVLWAVDKGVTNGMSATSFAPGATCTRAHVVTFLYRAMTLPGE